LPAAPTRLGDLVNELTYLRISRAELKAHILFEMMLHRYRGITGGAIILTRCTMFHHRPMRLLTQACE